MKDLNNLLEAWKNIREELNKAKEDKRVPAEQRKQFRQQKKKLSGRDPMAGRQETQPGVSARGIETRRGDTRQKGVISHGYARVADPEKHKETAKQIARQELEDTKASPKPKLTKEEMTKDSVNPKLAPKDNKVKRIQQQVDAGTYKPDPKKIAGKMVERGVFTKSGQWSIEKSNYGPKGSGAYTPTDNMRRKQTRTAEEAEVGPNKGVRQYTTSGSKMSDVRNKKLTAQNKKQPVRTMKDMSPEEIAEIKRKYKAASEDGVEKFSTGAPVTAAAAPVGGVAMSDKDKR